MNAYNRGVCSGEQAGPDPAVYVGEAVLAALVAESQLRVVDPAEVQDRRLHVVNVDGVGRDVPGVVVGRPVNCARFDAAPREPPTVRLAEVVPTLGIGGGPLPARGAAALAAPDDPRVVPHPPLPAVQP